MAVDTRLVRGVRGLGLYPGDSCYDPNKSWYWPNWMTSPAEQACTAAQEALLVNPPPPVPPGVPAIIATRPSSQGGSNVTPEQAAEIVAQQESDTMEVNKSQLQKFFEDMAASLASATPPPAAKPCSWYQTGPGDGDCRTGGALFWGLVIGGGVLAIVVAAKR